MERQQQIHRPRIQRRAEPASVQRRAEGIPNSGMAGLLAENDRHDPGLLETLNERIRQLTDSQIPSAEREADELAKGASGTSAAEIKASLGAQMGADFSGVRFHTGPDAVAKAEAMGARAYTNGLDVFFGEGGFAPDVAAHELVHTAQQGVVESAVATESVATGTVQMIFDEYKRNRMIRRINAEMSNVVNPQSAVRFVPGVPTGSSTTRICGAVPPASRFYDIQVDPFAPLGIGVPRMFDPSVINAANLNILREMSEIHEKTHAAADLQYAANRSGARQFQLSRRRNPSDHALHQRFIQQSYASIRLTDLLNADATIPTPIKSLFAGRLARAGGAPGEWDSVMNELLIASERFGISASRPFVIAIRKAAELAMWRRTH